MLAVLREAGLMPEAKLVNVVTQMTVPGVSIVDLVLAFDDGSEIWIEVKVDAGESGNQLNNYLDHLRRNALRSKLVTLAKHRLRDDVVPLTWQQLRHAIDTTSARKASSPYWADLRTYLEEIRMADSFDEPLQDAELRALGAAHSLLRKMARILVPAAEHAATLAPYLDWPNGEDDVLKNLGVQFRRHGLMNFSTRAKLRAGISVGAYAEDGDTGVGVWVWSKTSGTAVRRQLLERADGGKLPPAWERSHVDWEGLGVYTKLREVMDPGVATRWLVERLDELNAAGIMALLPALGLGEAEDQEGPEE